MNITFIGGGSLRIPPIARAMMQDPRILQQGEIRLYDIDPHKAQVVATAIKKAPEFKNCGIRVWCPDDRQSALEGSDVVYITMGFQDRDSYREAATACKELGFIASDNLSPTGAFLSLIGGPIILGIARDMETYCPHATLLIFANPVAVYSGLVNNHTSIRAWGLCGGHFNHRHDLARLMGLGDYEPGFDLDVAGVNHMSFVNSGTCNGRDIREVLDENLACGRPAFIPSDSHPMLKVVLEKMRWLYTRFGHILFSSEMDGVSHLFYGDLVEGDRSKTTAADAAKIKKIYPAPWTSADFEKRLAQVDETTDWNRPGLDPRYFGVAHTDLATRILKARAGLGRVKLVASAPNNGAVRGFTDRTVLEFSQWFDQNTTRPVDGLELPSSLHALVAPLADFQTRLGDAIANNDPQLLAEAMWTYPIHHDSAQARSMVRQLLAAFKDDINPAFQATNDYL